MKQIFFTSDHHFGHANIIKFCDRPFQSVEEMDLELIKRWNEKIKPEDEVYHLGDFALAKDREVVADRLDQLNGIKYLIKGNHEGAALHCRKQFKWVKDYHELKIKDSSCKNGVQRIILFHYAMRVWRGDYRGTWQLYGHSHGKLPDKKDQLAIDVGVDAHDYYPVSYDEVKAIMSHKTWVPPFENVES